MEPLQVTNEEGKKIGVLILVSDYEKLLAELEATKMELAALKASIKK